MCSKATSCEASKHLEWTTINPLDITQPCIRIFLPFGHNNHHQWTPSHPVSWIESKSGWLSRTGDEGWSRVHGGDRKLRGNTVTTKRTETPEHEKNLLPFISPGPSSPPPISWFQIPLPKHPRGKNAQRGWRKTLRVDDDSENQAQPKAWVSWGQCFSGIAKRGQNWVQRRIDER